MLALSRKKNEAIIINNDIEITILDIRGDQVKVGIAAPKEIPIYRRYVGGPLLDIFGKQVEVSRTPWSREYLAQPEAREYRLLGQLGSNGLWLTPADPANRRVGRGKRSREMTDAEQKRFVTIVGNNYRDLVLKHGERLTKMPHENAKELMGKLSAAARDRAERAALAAPATQP